MANIVKKVIFKVPVTLKSPLRIGCGYDDGITDLLVLKAADGRPLVPATSLAGVLRQQVRELYDERLADFCFGQIDDSKKAKPEIGQSRVYVDDLILDIDGEGYLHRDGVAIDDYTGIGIDGAKFDYEAVDRGASGVVQLEITLRAADVEEAQAFDASVFRHTDAVDFWDDFNKTLADIFYTGIHVGSLTAKGFGLLASDNKDVPFYTFDFSKPGEFYKWLDYLDAGQQEDYQLPVSQIPYQAESVQYPEDTLVMDMQFGLKSSLLVRDYNAGGQSDSSVISIQMKNHDDFVIPGTTIKGVIRHRAQRLLRKIFSDSERRQDFINHLMGYANESKGVGQQSHLMVHEAYIPSSQVRLHKQTRNRIDRLTGGTIEGALFSEAPIWRNKDFLAPVHFKWSVKKCQDREAGLLFLVMRDLWMGNVPIGGGAAIGRGVLQGQRCHLRFKQWDIVLEGDGEHALSIQGMQKGQEATPQQCMDFLEQCVAEIGR